MTGDDCEMTDSPAPAETPHSVADGVAGGRSGAMNRLPTLQRNALRKIFDRHDFLPEEVVALGYRRLQQAEGIGSKGLSAISAWLAEFGLQLEHPPVADQTKTSGKRRVRLSIDQAVRLLRTHGFEVVPAERGVSGRRR